MPYVSEVYADLESDFLEDPPDPELPDPELPDPEPLEVVEPLESLDEDLESELDELEELSDDVELEELSLLEPALPELVLFDPGGVVDDDPPLLSVL